MVDRLRALVSTDRAQLIGKDLGNGFVVKDGDDFEYTDPIDGSVSKKQASGQFFFFSNGHFRDCFLLFLKLAVQLHHTMHTIMTMYLPSMCTDEIGCSHYL